MLEQIQFADVFVHYDDVQFSKGSFTNRVQVKMPDGTTRWMTIPIKALSLGQKIDQVQIKEPSTWLDGHMSLLKRSFETAPFRSDALGLAEAVLSQKYSTLAHLSRTSMLALANYFGIMRTTRFVDSKSMDIEGRGSDRVYEIVKYLGGDCYITGHGARRYLKNEMFEANGVEVRYMSYELKPYSQGHGTFTPYVTALDLVAHIGRAGVEYMQSKTVNWKELENGSHS